MPSRKPVWCVSELKDGQWHPVAGPFDFVQDAEERKEELEKEEKFRGKNLQVLEATYPVDSRKPPRRRR
jgi:hypothetical protein